MSNIEKGSIDINIEGDTKSEVPPNKENLPAQDTWIKYLDATDNPYLKAHQAEIGLQLQLNRAKEQEEIELIRKQIKELGNIKDRINQNTLNDIELSEKIGWDNVILQRTKDTNKFKAIKVEMDKYSNDPEFMNKELYFKPGDFVKAPVAENSTEMVNDWVVAEAKNGHYVIERKRQDDQYDTVVCDEQELLNWGNQIFR